MNKIKKGLIGIIGAAAVASSIYFTRETPLNTYQSPAGSMVTIHGSPRVILIPQTHAIQRGIQDQSERDVRSVQDVATICRDLYDKYAVHSVVLEGVPPQIEQKYNETGQFRWEQYPFLTDKKWKMIACERQELHDQQVALERPIRDLQQQFKYDLQTLLERHLPRAYSRKGDVFERKDDSVMRQVERDISSETNILQTKYDALIDEAVRRIEMSLRDLLVEQRERNVIAACKEASGRVIVVYGAAHTANLKRRFEEAGLEYCVIEPVSLGTAMREYTNRITYEKYHVTGGELTTRMSVMFDNQGKAHVRFAD